MIRFSSATAIAAVDAVVAKLDAGGSIEVYNGIIPANSDTAIGTQVKLVTFVIPAPGYGDATSTAGQTYAEALGEAIAPAIPVAAGTATWARVKDNAGNTVFDGDVGNAASSAMVKMSTTTVTQGVGVSVLSSAYRQAK